MVKKVEIEIPKVKIFGVSGSPRKDHNTDRLVKMALESAEMLVPGYVETRFVPLSNYVDKLRGCVSCGACYHPDVADRKAKGKKICPRFDDGMEELYDLFFWCDAMIVGSPTYGANMSWLTKAFLDRLGSPFGAWGLHKWMREMGRKVVGFCATGASEHGGAEGVVFGMDQWFSCFDTIRVSAGTATTAPIGSYYGGITWCPTYRADGNLLDPTGIRSARSLGKRVAEVAAIYKAGESAWAQVSDELVEENAKPTPDEADIEIDWDKYMNDPYTGEGIAPAVKIGIPLRIAISEKCVDKVCEYAKDPPKETYFHLFRFKPDVFRRVWKDELKAAFVSDGKMYKHDPEFFSKYLKKKK
jgi:multimeric flavodoxin WrbA